jgi:hypothetical protein
MPGGEEGRIGRRARKMKAELRIRRAGAQHKNLFRLAPDNVFVIPPINQSVDLAVGVVTEKNPAFDVFAEKEFGSFGEQLFLFIQLFLFAFALDE